MSDVNETARSELSADEFDALRIAEECARSALRSSENALHALERAEGSLAAGEDRMAEVSAAAVIAAGEATEAKLRATEIATEFRLLEEQVTEALSFEVRPGPGGSGDDADFDRLWAAFERRANRVIERLRALDAGEITVSGPHAPRRRAERAFAP